MARGEPPRDGPAPRDRPPLPAPYRSPWTGLSEALRAVLADLRLSLQRLWRRNREGELPLPGFWPQDLAPLFWPLLLSAALALLLLAGGWLLRATGRPAPPAAAGVAQRGALTATAATRTLPLTAVESGHASPTGDGLRRRPGPAGTTGGDGAGQGDRGTPHDDSNAPGGARAAGTDRPDGWSSAQGRPEGDGTLAGSRDGEAPDAGSTPAPELRLDPLLELLSQGDTAELLQAAQPDPARSRLSLTLSDAAEALPQAALLEQAQRWQQRAREAGYEKLELRDPQGRLRGREALVGSGMILLAPVPDS